MAYRNPQELSRDCAHAVRRMDYLETGVLPVPERLPGAHRARVHDSIGKNGHHLHPVRAWATLSFIVLSVGATAAAWYIQWRYG